MKFASGVYVYEPSAFNPRLPFSGPVDSAAFNKSPSASVSFARTPGAATFKTASSSTLVESFAATGASLTAATLNVTVAVSLPPLPSEAVYVNESPPL